MADVITYREPDGVRREFEHPIRANGESPAGLTRSPQFPHGLADPAFYPQRNQGQFRTET
jgi:hypothetical protein